MKEIVFLCIKINKKSKPFEFKSMPPILGPERVLSMLLNLEI